MLAVRAARLFVCLVAPLSVACSRPAAEACFEPVGQAQSPLGKAPRNGAQYGGTTVDASGVSEGQGAPGAAADQGYGLLRIYVLLQAPGAGLTEAQKSGLADVLDDVRDTGALQAFVRAYYESPVTSKADAAGTKAKIASDIAALEPILSSRLDIIPFIQAGFLGPWGEWWDGDLEGADPGTDQQLRTLKTGVVDALKSAFPTTFIQMRYPRDIATYYPDDPQISFHDDSVLAGSDDGGTFNATKKNALWPSGDPAAQRAWIKERSVRLLSVNAGESSQSTPDVSCDALIAYLKEYRIFVFNAQWPSVVTKCSDQLKSQLHWDGPLAPAGGGGGSGGGSGGAGGGSGGPGYGTELGCWATDQRPWQLCNPQGCETGRCRRAPADGECTMYRAAACTGDWPPAGYPGEETVTVGAGGAPPVGGAGGPTGSGGTPGNGGGSGPGGGSSGAAIGGSSEPSGGVTGGGSHLPPTSGMPAGSGDCP
jgi:hypothetical protein